MLPVGQRQDLGREIPGVLGPGFPDRDAGYRHTARHLHGREQGIEATEGATRHRDPDHGLDGDRSHRAGEVCG